MKSILVMTGMVVFIIFSAFICVSAMEFSADVASGPSPAVFPPAPSPGVGATTKQGNTVSPLTGITS